MIFAVIGVVAIIIFIASGISAKRYKEVNYDYDPVEYFGLSAIELEFVRLVNEHRINLGLNPFIVEELASKVCYYQNLEDIKLGVPSSHDHWDRMRREAKVNLDNCGHIHSNNHSTAQKLFQSYMDSKEGHKEQLQHPTRTHIGISFYQRRSHILITKYE